MTRPIKFGRELIIERNGNVVTHIETVIANFQDVKQVRRITEIVPVDDEQGVHIEFLKLLDKQKKGEIDGIGIQCIRNETTGKLRVETSWIA